MRALRGVNLEVFAGEVHALLGENGAGKSTLIKILSGVHSYDEGSIEIDGEEITFDSPARSRDAGVAVVYQDLSLVESLSVGANLMLGREPRTRLGFLKKRQLMLEVDAFLERQGIPLDSRAQVGSLPFAYRQMTEICKALMGNVRLLVLDEPTSALAGDEERILFDAIRASVSSFSGEEVSLRSARNQAVQNGTQLVTVLSFASALMVSIIIAIFVRGELRRLTNTYSRTLQYVSQQAAQISADREWFRAIFASIGDAVVVTNTARKVTFVNRVAESLIGAAAPEGQPLSAILDIRHETNGRPIDDPLMAIQTMSDRLSLTNHLLLARPAQPDLPIELAASPLQNTKGAFDGVVLVFRDITARLGIQRNLEASEARYRELADAMPLIVWTTTADGTTDYYSRGWYDFTGQSPADFSSASWQPILHPDDLTRCLEIWTVSLQTGQRFEMEYRWRGADGDYRWFLGRAVAVTDAHGSIQRWIGTGTDIDAQKRAEEKLSALTEALEDRNVELDQFAYVTSHDLKAPLRGIANLSQWIEEDLGANATPEIHEQMALLQGRVHRMEALIDGILQYSRIGRVKIPVETVDVAALLSEIIDLLPLPDGFQIVVTPGMPTLSTERILLQQVFANLINNAIKHHHEAASGRITVSCTALRRVYEFVVADNGPGIAPIYHEKIFAIFQTLQSRDKVEGSGLGLSLVKKIVETHGGEIKVDSQEGAGAKFRFTWPKVPSRAGGD